MIFGSSDARLPKTGRMKRGGCVSDVCHAASGGIIAVSVKSDHNATGRVSVRIKWIIFFKKNDSGFLINHLALSVIYPIANPRLELRISSIRSCIDTKESAYIPPKKS
jgi:hypothetical protein